MEPFLGQIMAVGFNFAPKGWAFCNGALLSIQQNSALFSLLGTAYGGDGITTFALPNLQSRAGVGMQTNGNLGGLNGVTQGEVGGLQNITLTQNNLPTHTHAATVALSASSSAGGQSNPNGNILAAGSALVSEQEVVLNNFAAPTSITAHLAPSDVAVQAAGSSQPVSIQNPYIGLNFIIALEGVYPSRS